MIIAYKLSMPNVGSWNNKWSGEGKLYAKTRSYTSKAAKAKAEKILAKGSFCYSWPDGWEASVSAEKVDSKTASKICRKSNGFRGYEWMISSIEERLFIATESDLKKEGES